MSGDKPLLDPGSRELGRRWLKTWQEYGPILDPERWERLANMTDEEGRRATRWVLELWQPGWRGDEGEGLILRQQVFARARKPRSRP